MKKWNLLRTVPSVLAAAAAAAMVLSSTAFALSQPAENPSGNMVGGWKVTETPDVTEDALAALEKAAAEEAGTAYEPVALLSTQLVSGMNYCLLCRITTEDEAASYGLVYVYADLQGNASLADVQPLEYGIGKDPTARKNEDFALEASDFDETDVQIEESDEAEENQFEAGLYEEHLDEIDEAYAPEDLFYADPNGEPEDEDDLRYEAVCRTMENKIRELYAPEEGDIIIPVPCIVLEQPLEQDTGVTALWGTFGSFLFNYDEEKEMMALKSAGMDTGVILLSKTDSGYTGEWKIALTDDEQTKLEEEYGVTEEMSGKLSNVDTILEDLPDILEDYCEQNGYACRGYIDVDGTEVLFGE